MLLPHWPLLYDSENSALSSINTQLQPRELEDKDKYLPFYLKSASFFQHLVNSAIALMLQFSVRKPLG